jgi:hypothetical protein
MKRTQRDNEMLLTPYEFVACIRNFVFKDCYPYLTLFSNDPYESLRPGGIIFEGCRVGGGTCDYVAKDYRIILYSPERVQLSSRHIRSFQFDRYRYWNAANQFTTTFHGIREHGEAALPQWIQDAVDFAGSLCPRNFFD